MSKTYKHQAKYDNREYWRNNHSFGLMPVYDGDTLIGWKRKPPESELPEPHPWYGMWIELKRAGHYHRESNRKCRRQVKDLIHHEKYVEAEMLKPENVDWNIW